MVEYYVAQRIAIAGRFDCLNNIIRTLLKYFVNSCNSVFLKKLIVKYLL